MESRSNSELPEIAFPCIEGGRRRGMDPGRMEYGTGVDPAAAWRTACFAYPARVPATSRGR